MAIETEVKGYYQQVVQSWTLPWRSLVARLGCLSWEAQLAAVYGCRLPLLGDLCYRLGAVELCSAEGLSIETFEKRPESVWALEY